MDNLPTTPGSKAFVLRTGVLMPDWSLITARWAKQALDASFEITNRNEKWRHLEPAEDRVWQAILQAFRATGRSPDERDVAARSGLDPAAVSRWLRTLERRDLIVLDRDGAVSAAYPFCTAFTGHRVRFSDQVVNALCAIDALGAGAMFGRDTIIASSCPQCSAAIRIRTGERGLVILEVAPAEAVVWYGLQYAGGCAATSGCKAKTFFCSDEHLRAWRDRSDRHGGGFRLTVAEAAQVGMAMFVPMLAARQ
jgi:Alkylmercury lyase/IclR helix-turn-helix domain